MPDAFGNLTPDEASALIRQQFADQRAAFAETPLARTPGGQAGASLGAIFGGTIRKSLETRGRRKTETERLVEETGISRGEARALAKENIPRDFNEIAKAKKIAGARSVAQQVFQDAVDAGSTEATARSNSMFVMADQLNELGFRDEGAAMTQQATQIAQEEELRVLGIEEIKVGIASTRGATAQQGATPLTRLQEKRATAELALDGETDPNKVADLERNIREINQQIEADAFKSGLTEADERAAAAGSLTKTVKGKLQQSVIDSANQLGLLTSIGETFEPEFLQFVGKTQARITELLDASGIINPSKEAKRFLARQTAFQRNSINSLNLYIKLITGAQMSNAEADRLRKGIPDPERDGPTKFISKYIETIRQTMAVAARANAVLRDGTFGLLPTTFKNSLEDAVSTDFGADLAAFTPTAQQAIRLLGLEEQLKDFILSDEEPPTEFAAGEQEDLTKLSTADLIKRARASRR